MRDADVIVIGAGHNGLAAAATLAKSGQRVLVLEKNGYVGGMTGAFPVPDSMNNAEAAGWIIPFHTAYVGLVRRGTLKPDESILVLGAAGGAGSAAVQLAKALGARVIATAGGPKKAAFCKALGADVVIDYNSEEIASSVRAATDGRGADVIYDAVGGSAFDAATRCIAHEGRLLAVGFASGSWGEPRPEHLVTHNYSILGVMPSGYDRAFKDAAQDFLLEHWRGGALRTSVQEIVPFERIPDAVELVARGEVMGKVIIE